MDFHSYGGALYLADFWGFSCSRDAWGEEGNPGSSGVRSAGCSRDSCICRIYRWYRDYIKQYGRIYYRIYFFGPCYVGGGGRIGEKDMGAGGIHGSGADSLLCIRHSMVYVRLCKKFRGGGMVYCPWMVRDTIYHSRLGKNSAGSGIEQKAGGSGKNRGISVIAALPMKMDFSESSNKCLDILGKMAL